MNEKGWICPSCGRGVRPDEKTCDHGGLTAGPLVIGPYLPQPTLPQPQPTWQPPTWPRVVCGSSIGTTDPNVILMN